MNTRWMVGAAMATLLGCGGPEHAANEPTPRPRASVGLEEVAVDEAPTPARPPAAFGAPLSVTVNAPSPVGMVPEDEAKRFPIEVEVVNNGPDAIPLAHIDGTVAVYRAGELVCEAPAFGVIDLEDERGSLASGASRRLEASLPCALPEPADYQLIVDVVARDPSRLRGAITATDVRGTDSVALRISSREPPFGYDQLVVAEAPVRDSDTIFD